MDNYSLKIQDELQRWQERMQKRPSVLGRLSKDVQNRINAAIPERIHQAITKAIEQMTKGVILGARITTPQPVSNVTQEEVENKVQQRIRFYRNTAAAEGAITGAGGILLGLADFPIWLTIKIKMLFEIASLYGYNVKDYKERVFILHIFQLTFSSQKHRNEIYSTMANWPEVVKKLPDNLNDFNWRSFQQEYRDFIDIAKLLQLIPGIGAVVGAWVNHRLTEKLGYTAMNAYRMRWLQEKNNAGPHSLGDAETGFTRMA